MTSRRSRRQRPRDPSSSLRSFRTRKELLLRDAALGLREPVSVLVSLENYYHALARDYLSSPGSSTEAWLARGPHTELEEVRAAVLDVERHSDRTAWLRLVEPHTRTETP